MKHVIAVVKPFKQDEVITRLSRLKVQGLSWCEVRGYGRQKGHLELYRGSEYQISFLPKIRVEFSCEDEDLETALSAIVEEARTGRIGDGKIFIVDAQSPGDAP